MVLVIVGMLAGTVVAAFPNVGHERQVRAEAERLALAFELARSEALRRNELWGLAVAKSGYSFHRYGTDGNWRQVSRRPLAPWSMEKGITLGLAASAAGAPRYSPPPRPSPQDDVPDIAIHAGGETTPFAVEVAGADGEEAWIVHSDGFARAKPLPARQAAQPGPPTLR